MERLARTPPQVLEPAPRWVLLALLLIPGTPFSAVAQSSAPADVVCTAPFRSFGISDHPGCFGVGDVNGDLPPDLVLARDAHGTLDSQQRPERVGSPYSAVDLGTLGGGYGSAKGMNDRGQVVGYSEIAVGGARAFLWQDGVMTDLGGLGSTASAINNHGWVVGGSWTSSGQIHAVLWQGGTMVDLGTLGWFSDAYDVNDRGQVVGMSTTLTTLPKAVGFLWQDGVMTDLGTLGGESSVARAINNRGQIVGSSWTAAAKIRATLWQDGVISDLGDLGGGHSRASDINERGQVVGISRTARGAGHAFLWQNGTMIDLGTLGGSQSEAVAINDRGQVAGWSQTATGEGRAFLWQDGVMTDVDMGYFWDIDNRGSIVGESGPSIRPTLWTAARPPSEAVAGSRATAHRGTIRLASSPGTLPVNFEFRGRLQGTCRINVFDVRGRLVRRWTVNGEVTRGSWDGRNGEGAIVAPGVYFLRVSASGKEFSTKVVVAR